MTCMMCEQDVVVYKDKDDKLFCFPCLIHYQIQYDIWEDRFYSMIGDGLDGEVRSKLGNYFSYNYYASGSFEIRYHQNPSLLSFYNYLRVLAVPGQQPYKQRLRNHWDLISES